MKFSGNTPAATRRWIWMRKYGKEAFPKGNPEEIVRWYMDALESAVKKITGEDFDTTEAFRAWLTENAGRLGLKARDLDKRKRPRLEPKPPKHPPEDEKKGGKKD